MNQKIIWYCHPTAGSPKEGMSYRPYYLCKYWKKQGHQAYVLSSSFHHLLQKPCIQKEKVKFQTIDETDYIRLKTLSYQDNGIKRILSMFSYALRFLTHRQEILKITGIPDIIIVSSTHPFHYLTLYPYAKKHKIPLIFEVRDLWPSSLIELLKLKKWHPLVVFLSFIEKHAYKHSRYVVSLLADAKPYMVAKGLESNKFIYIPNGTDCATNPIKENLPEELKKTISKLKESQQFIIGYAGAIGIPNAMEHFIQAMELIHKTHPNIQAILVGKGCKKQELINYCQNKQISNVHFFDPIPKTQVHHFLKKMDILYLGWQDTNLYQYGVSPNKIFDYMLASRPILESGGAPTSLVDLAGCGIVCSAANYKIISKNILTASELSKKKLTELGKKGYDYVHQNHDYPALAKLASLQIFK